MAQWRRRGADPAELDALHPGVPSWMQRPLLQWAIAMTMEDYTTDYFDTARRPNVEILQSYETAVRRTSSLMGGYREGGAPFLIQTMDQEEFIDFIDFLAHRAGSMQPPARQILGALEKVLSDAGSEWTVGERDGFPALAQRVPAGVVAAVTAITSEGTAGSLLAEAWQAAFGRNPDPEEAYEKAIKAVEEAGTGVVSPKNVRASLGTVARDMENQKDWKLPLGEDPAHPSADVPYKMIQSLWAGQESRHGGNGYRKPTQDEAEAAVLLAVPLVQWFSSGTVARRP